METNHLIQLYIHANNNLHGNWQMFVTVNIAIFGWLILKKQKTERSQKIAGIVAYLFFATLIYFSFEKNHSFYKVLAGELVSTAQKYSKAEVKKSSQFIEYLSNPADYSPVGKNYPWGGCWILIYVVSAFGVCCFIYRDKLNE